MAPFEAQHPDPRNKPTFSIVTVVYNAQDTVRQTVESVLSQVCNDYEYIIIDGGSTDGTLRILDEYRGKFACFLSESDRGIYDAMNKAATYASGDFLQYLNAGDRFHSADTLKTIAERCEASHPDALYGDVVLTHKGRSVRKVRQLTSLSALARGRKIVHQSLFVRRDALERIGPFDRRYNMAADFDLECRLFKAFSDIRYLPTPLVKFDMDGTTHHAVAKSYAENIAIIKSHFGMKKASMYSVSIAPKRLLSLLVGPKHRMYLRRLLPFAR